MALCRTPMSHTLIKCLFCVVKYHDGWIWVGGPDRPSVGFIIHVFQVNAGAHARAELGLYAWY